MVSGALSIEEFNRLAGATLPSEDFGTVGGYVLHLFGKLPARGDEVNVGGLHLDAYGLVLIVSERSTRGTSLRGYDGTYASSALIGGLNATYRF